MNTAKRPTRIQALTAFLVRFLEGGESTLQKLTEEISGRLAGVRDLRVEKEGVYGLHLKQSLFDPGQAHQYRNQNSGHELIDDYNEALAAWLEAVYTLPNEPAMTFDVKIDHGQVAVTLKVKYLPVPPTK